ncbi:ABC transporter permease [Sulfurospirillum barnesii]|uniref:ABC-type dipeptide/oligopeptide/nickel transport system, permease component n=1 Tax=Sulfurospirillum barnesii (strain ATCC 700032 / DSM 10660 / SES-3) TaxID=760154 RepID=I3XV14_SULBS|nr:ABC transporter permease [Sulfurospirillum barnesii]AFL67788.1 ABC-type dipeptide/oligopeptide/nickel transport system, permease component [Sulfurospirillum barnesii SES-3]
MKLVLQKISYVVLMLSLISLISFGAIHLAPNSFFASGELNPNITPEALEQLKAIYGLDQSLWMQFFSWFKAILHLDFGISFASGKLVRDEILARLPITLFMNIISMVCVFVLALYWGIKSAMRQTSLYDKTLKQFALISYAMPSFYLALLLVIFFAVEWKIFPISGLHSQGMPYVGWRYMLDTAWHLVLPIFVMVFGGLGSLILYVRSLTLNILKSDYIFFAKSRGIEGRDLLIRFILPNLSPPLITMLGLSLPGLIGGSVILESIFAINGMGLLFYQSALSRDYPVIMGILIISSFLTLIGNIVADLVLTKLNPHFKRRAV